MKSILLHKARGQGKSAGFLLFNMKLLEVNSTDSHKDIDSGFGKKQKGQLYETYPSL